MTLDMNRILNPKPQIEQRSKWEKASITTKHRIKRKEMESNKPLECPICKERRRLELSNKDHEYKEDLGDWRYLCHQCHRQYDMKNNNYKFYKKFNSVPSDK